MLIKNKKMFNLGAFLAMTFIGVLLFIFSPAFDGQNGLVFADKSFNKLAKGSSYFIPKVSKNVEKFAGTPLSSEIKLEDKETAENTAKLFTQAGATVEIKDNSLKISGNLGAILQTAVADADLMYKNDGKAVADKYGYEEKKVMKNWWLAFDKIEKGMKKSKMIAEAKIVNEVNKKAVEPGYNFYKIDANKVSEHVGMMSGLLVFYVLYTMWWGYAIFFLFDGVGLSMKKSKVKKEA